MPDSLARLVTARDREHAQRSRVEPERLILAPRTTFAKRICWDCRRAPAEALWAEFHEAWKDASEDERERLVWPPLALSMVGDTCPECGGLLVEIS